jgi:hypothetical protein
MDKTHSTDPSSGIFLTGTILLANIDYSGLADYAVKALIGGGIWMLYRIAGEYLGQRLMRRKDKDEKEQ